MALGAIRNFVGNFGRVPTAEAWTTAGMTPSEKTFVVVSVASWPPS